MAAILELPPDLVPRALVYQDELPEVISAAIQECSNHWRRGDVDKAIRSVEQARALAQANNQPVSESVVCVWMADLYREMAQLGPALECCQGATNALRLQPSYEHRYHIEAVIAYLQGLFHRALGVNTEALADYQRALTSFEKAIKHWESNIARNPSQVSKYRQQVDKCEKAIRWINVLSQCLAGDLSPINGGMEMQIPVTDGQDYGLASLKLAAYLLPLDVTIRGKRYRLHRPDDGIPFDVDYRLEAQSNTHYFVVHVPKERWAGEHSARGDYVLARRERKADNPVGAGVLWDDSQQQWKYGTFVRDAEMGEIRFRPLPPIVIGGAPQEEEIEDHDIGVVRALLKPLKPM